jgi:hypothetical protein
MALEIPTESSSRRFGDRPEDVDGDHIIDRSKARGRQFELGGER